MTAEMTFMRIVNMAGLVCLGWVIAGIGWEIIKRALRKHGRKH